MANKYLLTYIYAIEKCKTPSYLRDQRSTSRETHQVKIRYTMAYPRFCPEPKIVLANYQIANKDLEAEFSDCDYASGLSSSNRRHLVRYDKAASGIDKGKKGLVLHNS